MLGVLGAFGLAAATGLNAYLPLLIVGLLARIPGPEPRVPQGRPFPRLFS